MRIPVATELPKWLFNRHGFRLLVQPCHQFPPFGGGTETGPPNPSPNLWKEGRADARLAIEHFCLSLTSQAQPATGEGFLLV